MADRRGPLQRIVAVKREEVARAKSLRDLAAVRAAARAPRDVRGFEQALRSRTDRGRPAVIAEIREGLGGRRFESLDEANAYAREITARRNSAPIAPWSWRIGTIAIRSW